MSDFIDTSISYYNWNGVIEMMNLIEIWNLLQNSGVDYALVGLAWLTATVILFSLTFLFYLAVIHLRDMQENDTIKDLHWTGRGLGYAFLYIGLVMDAVLNWVGLTVTLMEIPKEFLCTARVIRHKYSDPSTSKFAFVRWLSDKRHEQALWWCAKWLTPVDKRHCEK